jgi:hypothetical protein
MGRFYSWRLGPGIKAAWRSVQRAAQEQRDSNGAIHVRSHGAF